jgi:hypothetical protein
MSFVNNNTQNSVTDSYWVRFCDENHDCGYLNAEGDTMIPAGTYPMCTTDTFRSYAIVLKTGTGFVGINKQEKILYSVYQFDNGPDYPSEGLFRIWKNDKMGYADERTGKIMLYPQYSCGFPFKNGVAKVSLTTCISKPVDEDGEYHYWETDEWIYIDHTGQKVDPPKE